jgi:hypothetical protein
MNDTYKKQIEAYVDNEITSEHKQKMSETIRHFPTMDNYAKKIEAQNGLLKLWWEKNKKNRH